jgi:hypothetical protein
MTIRKISIGTDYIKSMHYVVGQSVLDKSYVIDTIVYTRDLDVDIWISKDSEVIKWKTINKSMPFIVEHNIDF